MVRGVSATCSGPRFKPDGAVAGCASNDGSVFNQCLWSFDVPRPGGTGFNGDDCSEEDDGSGGGDTSPSPPPPPKAKRPKRDGSNNAPPLPAEPGLPPPAAAPPAPPPPRVSPSPPPPLEESCSHTGPSSDASAGQGACNEQVRRFGGRECVTKCYRSKAERSFLRQAAPCNTHRTDLLHFTPPLRRPPASTWLTTAPSASGAPHPR